MIKKIIKAVNVVFGNFVRVQSRLSFDEARKYLQEISPKPKGTCYTKNKLAIQYDLHIIIPAYNAEKYIKECLESVFIQVSEYSVLATVVNDGSTDQTSIILENLKKLYKGNQIDIEIINQDNKGYSGARNTALSFIRGKYIIFLDADDILPQDTIEVMLDTAYEYDADILQGSWYTFTNEEKKEYRVKESGRKTGSQGYISGYPWGKLYKYSVLENFQFPDGYWFEDTPISFILAALPFKCISIDNIVYGYRLNSEGITSKAVYTEKSIDSYWNTEQCLKEFPKFKVHYDQKAYEYLLQQSIMNAWRIRKQKRKVRESEFVLITKLMDVYFKGFHTKNANMRKVENALRKKQFIRFEMII